MRTIIPGSVAQEVKAAAAAGPRPLLWEARRRRLATPGQIEREEEFYNKAPSHNTGHGTGAHWHRRNEEVRRGVIRSTLASGMGRGMDAGMDAGEDKRRMSTRLLRAA